MVQGTNWAEAARRITQLPNLQGDAVEQVASVLRRELSVGTVVHIAELLEPAVRRLRDTLENVRSDDSRPLDAEATTTVGAVVSERLDWMCDLAWKVHKLVSACEENLKKFRLNIREWKRKNAQSFMKHPRQGVGENDQIDGTPPLYLGPDPALPEKHAALAAIHDYCLEFVKRRSGRVVEPINPWHDIPREFMTEGVAFTVLTTQRVPELSQDLDAGYLKEWLADVSAEMKPTGDIEANLTDAESAEDDPDVNDHFVFTPGGTGLSMPILSDRQYNILIALHELQATGSDSRQTTAEIAEVAEGLSVDPALLKEAVANLKRDGFVATKEGRGGGCWLTPEGCELAKRLAEKL